MRSKALKSIGGYSQKRMTLRAEDYDMWFRLYEKGYKGHNLSESLYKMRDDLNAYHRRKFKYALNEAYVRLTGYRRLNMPLMAYIYAFRPIIVNLLPKVLYMKLHHAKQRKKN
jgi:glycosyltransferase EpsE